MGMEKRESRKKSKLKKGKVYKINRDKYKKYMNTFKK
jgi:hypothetical protein